MPRDPYRYFRVEARELIDDLARGLLALEGGEAGEAVPRLLRLAHTLKGAARVVKRPEIAEPTHALEEALGELRSRAATSERVSELLRVLDTISTRVAALDAPPPAPAAPETAPALPLPVAGPEPVRAPRADVAELDAVLEGLSETSVQLRSTRAVLAGFEPLRQLAERVAEARVGAREPTTATREHPREPNVKAREHAREPSIRAGENAREADELRRQLERLEQSLHAALDQSERELQQVREAAERLRLVPASAIFAPLERTLRDAAHALGKRAALSLSGGEVRLEAQVLGQVQAALVQAVRNAIAHGIESPNERERAGKAQLGRIAIEIIRRGSRVAFVCADDGAGIDLVGVRARAGAAARTLGEAELIELLMRGGLSTARAVTELAGRGIGLDLVREIAVQLGGEARLQTSREGTRLELVVPVSLSSLDALVVEADGITAAIPLHAVRLALRLAPGEVTRTPSGDSIVHEGKVIPFLPLSRSLRQRRAPRSVSGPLATVVVQGATALAALGVDRLLGTANVVVRALPALAPADPVVAGASLDAEGMPRLVLDPDALVGMAANAAGAELAAPALARSPILVIDDSLTTRMLEQSILESAGYEVELATSAEEGLAKAAERPYALFLVDVEMPGMDGFAFVEKTRADPVLRDVPAILVSSRSAPEDLARGRAAGARDYIVKADFDQRRLLDTIRRLLSS